MNEFLEDFWSFKLYRAPQSQLLREVILLAMTQKPRVFFDIFPPPPSPPLTVYTKSAHVFSRPSSFIVIASFT